MLHGESQFKEKIKSLEKRAGRTPLAAKKSEGGKRGA